MKQNESACLATRANTRQSDTSTTKPDGYCNDGAGQTHAGAPTSLCGAHSATFSAHCAGKKQTISWLAGNARARQKYFSNSTDKPLINLLPSAKIIFDARALCKQKNTERTPARAIDQTRKTKNQKTKTKH